MSELHEKTAGDAHAPARISPRFLAGLLLLPALVLNPWTAEFLFAYDGEIGRLNLRLLLGFDALCATASAGVAYFRPAVDIRIVALVVGSFAVSLTLAEFSLDQLLRFPHLFARGPLYDVALDLYFTERHMFQFVGCAEHHPDLGYVLRTGGCEFENREFRDRYDVNRLGLRDDEASLDAPELIVLGDSHAMGWGVKQEAAFPQRLEQVTGLRTLNAAVSSYGTAREILNLARLDRQSLRVLVIQYCENDFVENGEFLSGGGELDVMTASDFERATKEQTRSTNYFPGRRVLRLVDRAAGPMIAALLSDPRRAAAIPVGTRLEHAERFLGVLQHLDLRSLEMVIVLEINPVRRMDSEFVDALATLLEAKPSNPEIRLVDVAPHLQPDNFYLLDDHMNASGHEIVARLVADEILSDLRISRATP